MAKPYRRQVWIALGLTLIQSGLVVLPGIFLRYLIDRSLDTRGGVAEGVSGADRMHSLLTWSGATFGVIVVYIVAGARLRHWSGWARAEARDLRHKVYAHLHELSLRFFGSAEPAR